MKNSIQIAVGLVCLAISTSASAVEFDVWELPPFPQETFTDLGDITSDGLGGRQILVRPLEPEEVGLAWKFFAPHDLMPDAFPEPTPATPAQSAIYLTSDMPLVLVLPQLHHKPNLATVSVSHSLNGQDITVAAALHATAGYTHTIYGLHEYLYSLGTLAPGDYRLQFDFEQTHDFSGSIQNSTGYVDFTVHAAAVPEPGAWAIAAGASAILVLRRRLGRRQSVSV